MQTFTVRDLRNRTGELISEAEQGHLSIITKHGTPVFVAVPFNDTLLQTGVRVSLGINMFAEGHVGLAQAAKIAGVSPSEMMSILAEHKIPMADYSREELQDELKQFTEE